MTYKTLEVGDRILAGDEYSISGVWLTVHKDEIDDDKLIYSGIGEFRRKIGETDDL